VGAAGVGVQARWDGFAELMSGRSYAQPGRVATGKDPVCAGNSEARGGCRSGAGARRSEEGGVTPADGVQDPLTGEGTPGTVPRGSGQLAGLEPAQPGHRAGRNGGAGAGEPIETDW
jgi:hypothetical protein